jgi:transposase
MRKTREVLRLRFACGLSKRRIAAAVGIGATAVGDYVARAGRAGLSWPLPAELSDEALERQLFPPPAARPAARPEPDWAAIHRELRRPDVTLALLWQEYRGRTPDGFAYSWFCEHYRLWCGRLAPTMRQAHRAGETLFTDYAGRSVEVVDGATGEIRRAQVFVAALGASSYIWAEASWTQGLADWVGAHVRCFAHLGGVPRQVVSDNLKAAVTRPCRYEPGLNPTFQELAEHYGLAILPARPRKPRDKAKVEVAVQVVQRWILARLRNRRFFALAELNGAVAALLAELNGRIMRHQGVSRRELFERIDRPALQPLPAQPYEYAQWRRCRVGLDYHVEIDGHFYSVPFRLLREVLEARSTAATVELFHRGKRVAAHPRALGRGRHSTVGDHMPSAHRAYADWTHEKMRRQAQATGPATAALVEAIMRARKHPEQGFRSCVGILRLAKSYGAERLEAACARALDIGAHSYTSLASILKSGLDRQKRPSRAAEPASDPPTADHPNIRGPRYYH